MTSRIKSHTSRLAIALASMMLALVAILAPQEANAQTANVSGTVIDEIDEPVVGELISDKNHKYTALTDADGNFTISSVP